MTIKILPLNDLMELFARTSINEEIPKLIRDFAARLSHVVGHIGRIETKLNAETKARQELQKHFEEIVHMIFKPVPEDVEDAEGQLFRDAQAQAMLSEVAKANLDNKLPAPEVQAPVDSPAVAAMMTNPELAPIAPNGSQKVQAS